MSVYMTDTFCSFTRNFIFNSCLLLSVYGSNGKRSWKNYGKEWDSSSDEGGYNSPRKIHNDKQRYMRCFVGLNSCVIERRLSKKTNELNWKEKRAPPPGPVREAASLSRRRWLRFRCFHHDKGCSPNIERKKQKDRMVNLTVLKSIKHKIIFLNSLTWAHFKAQLQDI